MHLASCFLFAFQICFILVLIKQRLEQIRMSRSGSSSNSSAGYFDARSRDLRYAYRRCGCGKKAMVKITEFTIDTKGMLYFKCALGRCPFWAWCNPISRDGQGLEGAMMLMHQSISQMKMMMVFCMCASLYFTDEDDDGFCMCASLFCVIALVATLRSM